GRARRLAGPRGDRDPHPHAVAGVLARPRAVLGALVDVVHVVGDRPLELALDLHQAAIGATARRGRGRHRLTGRYRLGGFAGKHVLDRLDHAREHAGLRLLAGPGLRTHLHHRDVVAAL